MPRVAVCFLLRTYRLECRSREYVERRVRNIVGPSINAEVFVYTGPGVNDVPQDVVRARKSGRVAVFP